MTTKLERLLFVRKRLMSDIGRQVGIIDKFGDETAANVMLSRKDALEDLWAEYKANMDAIEDTRGWIGSDEFITESAAIHDSYVAALIKLLGLIPEQTENMQQLLTTFRRSRHHVTMSEPNTSREEGIEGGSNNRHEERNMGSGDQLPNDPLLDRPRANSTLQGTDGLSATIKLPPLHIKTFSGNLIDWTEFKATCEATFAKIADDTHRFYYLKGFLTHEPAMLVKHLPLCEDSYSKAWNLLKKRYDNERAIIDTNIKQLVDLPVLQNESAEELKNMLNTVNGCIAAINSFKINTDTWDSILIFLLRQRLDANNIKNWEEYIQGSRKVPPFVKFTEFLEMRINILETTALTQVMKPLESKQKVFLATASGSQAKKCTICKQEHFAFQCPTLTTLSAEQRTAFVVSKGLCTNCLYPHKIEDCKSRFSCRHCSQRHHTALHPAVHIHNITTEESGIEQNINVEPEEQQAFEMQTEFIAHVNEKAITQHVKLATAIVRIEHNDRHVYARALIDQGATANLLSRRIAEALKLSHVKVGIPIVGVCDAVSYNVKT